MRISDWISDVCSSDLITAVGEALMPSMFSSETQRRSLCTPRLPSSFTMNLGTRKRLLPPVPSAAPRRPARPLCPLFPPSSPPPSLLYTFFPVLRYWPPSRFARLLRAPHSHPPFSPPRSPLPLPSPHL